MKAYKYTDELGFTFVYEPDHECEFCEKRFTSDYHLQSHIQDRHPEEALKLAQKSK